MKTFQQIKEDAVREFCSEHTRGYSIFSNGLFALIATQQMIKHEFKGTQKMIKEIEDKCVDAILRTDIRAMNDLIEVCPKSFPAYVRNNNYLLEYTDKGYVFFNKSQNC